MRSIQSLYADANVLIGDDIFAENTEPYADIICTLGDERRETVLRSIVIAEGQIRERLQRRVPARRQKRDEADEDEADADRRCALDTRLMQKLSGDAEVAASERVMRILAVAQSAGKDSSSAINVLESIRNELNEMSSSRCEIHLI